MKIAMVVAHPDDEILWGGGLPLRFPGDWTIIACTSPTQEVKRIDKFKEVCAVLGAKSVMYPELDPGKKKLLTSLDTIDLEPFDHIVTHNQWGEYGHPHHKQIHQHIFSKYKHKLITTFGFRLHGFNIFGYRWRSEGTHRLVLTKDELDRKMTALKKYDFPVKSGKDEQPLWQELLDLYCGKKGVDLGVETYDGHWFE